MLLCFKFHYLEMPRQPKTNPVNAFAHLLLGKMFPRPPMQDQPGCPLRARQPLLLLQPLMPLKLTCTRAPFRFGSRAEGQLAKSLRSWRLGGDSGNLLTGHPTPPSFPGFASTNFQKASSFHMGHLCYRFLVSLSVGSSSFEKYRNLWLLFQ